MRLIPKNVADGIVWIFSCAIVFMLLATIIARLVGYEITEAGYVIFKDVIKIMLGAVILYLGFKLRK